jgi:dynein heavy chain
LCIFIYFFSRHVSDAFFAQEGRKTYVTSAAYLELIQSYTDLNNAKQEEIMKAKLRYMGGLDKLLFAAEQVRQFLPVVLITGNDHENVVCITDGVN